MGYAPAKRMARIAAAHGPEPIPLQTAAMDQVSTVMGSDENVVEGLQGICSKNRPCLIGVPNTWLAETSPFKVLI